MAQIIWTEPALTDLNEIAEYIVLDKVEAACRLVEQVFKSVGQLEQFPESGRKPPELEALNHLEIIVNPVRIFYRLDQNKAYTLDVVRGERQLRNYPLGDRAQIKN
jgi:toxin ParE1/3/4